MLIAFHISLSNKSTQSSARISSVEKPYTFEKRHASLSEPMIPVISHATLSKPLYEPSFNIYLSIQEDLNRTRNLSQNQNLTTTTNRQLIHLRPNKSLTSTRVQFKILSSPSLTTLYVPYITIKVPLTTRYLFNSPNPSIRLPHWMTQAFSQGEHNFVNDQIELSSYTSLKLRESLFLPSTPSVTSQTLSTTFPTNFTGQLEDIYRQLQCTNKPLRLNWNSFVARPQTFGQFLDCSGLRIWALNRLKYRNDVHKDIHEYNFQILSQHN